MGAPSQRPLLGPFALGEPIGRGAMGEVWRATHEGTGLEVAVKVLPLDGARDRSRRVAFQAEVRALAALDHPAIARVLDHGTVDADAAARSVGKLTEGCPWVAMELARGGSLSPLRGRLVWREVRDVLLVLLDALAHAHARGVLHRDVKPANVLLEGGRPRRILLVDFGLASVFGEGATGGTPAYMAPEQFPGRAHEQGPWTDVYALGCLAVAMVQGRPPFQVKTMDELALAHAAEERPAIEPRIPLPDGFEDWVGRLLARDPRNRFRRAADAAWALVQLAETLPTARAPATPRSADRLEGVDRGAITLVWALETLVDPLGPGRAVEPPEPEPVAAWQPGRPPIPPSWRRPEPPRPPLVIEGAALGLWGLRSVPMVGRESERDRLWEELCRVARFRTPRAIVLAGPAGTGKDRLAAWLCERAEELGVATALRVRHGPVDAPESGLLGLLESRVRCAGTSGEEAIRRAEMALRSEGTENPREARALAATLAHVGARVQEARVQGARVPGAGERRALALRAIERAAGDRAAIVWLQDVQWGGESLRLVLEAFESRPAPPVLFLLTVREESLGDRPMEGALLRAISERTATSRLGVGPLDGSDHAPFVRAMLALDPGLTERVLRSFGGNPQFAVQLVGDWIERRALTPGPRGFALREEEPIPGSLSDLWEARVARLADVLSADSMASIEVAAVLGDAPDSVEWAAAAVRGGLAFADDHAFADDLADRLLRARLGVATSAGWAFASPALRDALLARASRAGRLPRWHAACAESVAACGIGPSWTVRERAALHRLAAGDPDGAATDLLAAGSERVIAGDYELAIDLLDRATEALDAAGIAAGDSRRGEIRVSRSRAVFAMGDLEAAVGELNRAEVDALGHGWASVAARAAFQRGLILRERGDARTAQAAMEVARRRFEALGDEPGVADCRWGQGVVALARGELDRARALLVQGRAAAARFGLAEREAECVYALGIVAFQKGEMEHADRLLSEAADRFAATGARLDEANALVGRADVLRAAGHLDRAEADYREALAIHRAARSATAVYPLLNLALVLIAQSRIEESRAMAEEGLAEATRQGRTALVGIAHALLLACTDDDSEWDRHFAEARRLLESTGTAEQDVVWAAERAAERSEAAGCPDRAAASRALAADQRRRLGRT